jgi:Putative PD-(D/E)XK phosphodiesterase (DUF2161)
MNRSDVRTILETSLYRPVKVFLEGLGFVVKGEVGGCDLVALKGDDLPVVVICELKLTFNLELILQGVDRATASDEVWLAARLSSRGKGRESDARFRNLCRRLGFGLLGVLPNGEVEVLVSPIAPMPRKNTRRRSRLVEEHLRRRGDPAEGGGIADADHDSISPASSRLRRRLGSRTATPAGPQGVDPRRLQYPPWKRLWLVRRGRARSLQPDRDWLEGASALAADDFVSRFAIPCNRRIEADHCLKINRE